MDYANETATEFLFERIEKLIEKYQEFIDECTDEKLIEFYELVIEDLYSLMTDADYFV